MLMLLVCTVAAGTAAKPNIMLVVADDLGYADVGWQTPNYSFVKTPTLNKLALGGIRFDNHHVQPFCSPTRACLMTGRHVLRYGLQNTVIWPQDAWALPLNETFLPQNLKAAGYYTAQFGKWHLGLYKQDRLPMARGFDEQYGYYLGGEDYFSHMRNGALDWHANDTLVTNQNGSYSADLIGDVMVDFVERRAKHPGTPWFVYLPWQSVHSPLQAPQESLDLYPELNGSVKTRAAMVSSMDTNMGRVMATLAATRQTDNLVIVFTADNGAPFGDAWMEGDDSTDPTYSSFSDQPSRPPAGRHGAGGGSNYPLSGWKHYVFEGGVRSASFIYSSLIPEAKRGSVHSGLFHAVDWLPTLAGLAGASTSQNLPLDGYNLWDALLAGGSESPRNEIPVEIAACGTSDQSIVDGPQAAMIVGDMKVIVACWWRGSKNASTAQLYNLTSDISELNDLAAKQPDDLHRLLGRLDYWESQSVSPYPKDVDGCGAGKGQGPSPTSAGYEYWGSWC